MSEEKKIDNVQPKEKWEFDNAVADCFENMLERSIPQYSLMRKSVADLIYDIVANNDITKSTYQILDLGCSDGIMIETLINRFSEYEKAEHYGYYTGVDISEPMLKKAKYRLLDNIIANRVRIDNCDLRNSFPTGLYDVVTAILSIQFIPIEYRQEIIQKVYDNLSSKDGCFIMVEKVLGNSSILNKLFIKNYYAMKSENGYSDEQIERKRLSLEGVLVPVTNDWNIDLLKQAGFRQVDVFWRWMNFVGYIAIK